MKGRSSSSKVRLLLVQSNGKVSKWEIKQLSVSAQRKLTEIQHLSQRLQNLMRVAHF
jgi:hypothetical protein